MKRILTLIAILAVAVSIRAQGPDEQYVQIYQLIQEADRLNNDGQSRTAAARYIEAQDALTRFRGIYPGWNERVINYRSSYIATKLAPLSATLVGSVAPVVPSTNLGTVFIPSTNVAAPVSSSVSPSSPRAATPPMSAEFEDQIKTLQAEVERLQQINRELAAKLREALSVQPAAMDPRELSKAEEKIRALQKENELFKAQLATKTNSSTASPAPDFAAKLSEQTEAIMALRAENEVLKKQTVEWRQKHEALLSASNAARSQGGQPASEMNVTVRQLTASNVELQKQVELWKQIAAKNSRPVAASSMPVEADRELASLRARLDVLEAKPVPYTREELALFSKSTPAVTAGNDRPAMAVVHSKTPPPAEGALRISRGIPTGAGQLVRAAERAFASGRYNEAEQKYAEILRQDENNVTTMANLASAQLEQGRVEDAEKNVRRALDMDPRDHFSLYLLGRIRFSQDKLDEALDALSRSTKANPDYADAQNYLGIVLSEKGLRGPAETALRRAVQLQPGNAVAHNNLAVVYAMQKPPALALARWHYKKAREAGHPPNAELERMLQ